MESVPQNWGIYILMKKERKVGGELLPKVNTNDDITSFLPSAVSVFNEYCESLTLCAHASGLGGCRGGE